MAVPHTGTEAWTAAMHTLNASECAGVNSSNDTQLVKKCDGVVTPWQAWYNSESPQQVSALQPRLYPSPPPPRGPPTLPRLEAGNMTWSYCGRCASCGWHLPIIHSHPVCKLGTGLNGLKDTAYPLSPAGCWFCCGVRYWPDLRNHQGSR
jgi:hypothetical protein